MKVVGLTGGIASGKSAVGRLLAGMGVPVLDADQLSRRVVEPGRPALSAIAARWPQVIRPDGTLDRAALGALVFADESERRALTSIVLPRVEEEYLRERARLEASGAPALVFEAATLLEEGMDRLVDGVLLVSAPPEEQIRRLLRREGYTREEALRRLAAQLPLAEKLARARWVLDNSGPESELPARVASAWQAIGRDLGLDLSTSRR